MFAVPCVPLSFRNQACYSVEVRWEIGAAAFDHRKLPITCHVIFPVTVISRFFRVSCLCRITVWLCLERSGTVRERSGTVRERSGTLRQRYRISVGTLFS